MDGRIVEDDYNEDWEEDDEEGSPTSYLGGWDFGMGQGQEENESDDEENESSDEEENIDSECKGLQRAPPAKRGEK